MRTHARDDVGTYEGGLPLAFIARARQARDVSEIAQVCAFAGGSRVSSESMRK